MDALLPVRELLRGAVGRVFPAAQLVVVDQGVELLSEAVGGASPETLFDLASLTKALCTTTLAMQAVEGGLLELDEPLRDGITPRQLLCHASGLPAWKLLEPARGARDPRSGIVETVRATALEATPGSRSVYSDLGFILLGDLLERRLGQRLDAAFADRVAGPLGLEMSFGPVAVPERCAPTEGELRGVVHDENCRNMGGVAGHAGLFSTAREVSRLVASLVGGCDAPAILRPETVKSFWSPCGVPGSTWCLGWDRPAHAGSSAGALWPRDAVGHLAFTGCSIWIAPPRGRWVILLSNRVYPSRANEEIRRFRPELHDAVWRALGEPAASLHEEA